MSGTPGRASGTRPAAVGTEWRGVALSLLVHGMLLAALLWGFRWHSQETEIVAAELWSAVPRSEPAAAAPPPPAPLPPPPAARPAPATAQPEADIAIEKARQEKAEKERELKLRAERERAEQERREQAERAEQEKRAQAERAEREKRAQAEREEKAAKLKAEKEAKARALAEQREKQAAQQREARQREANLARMMGQLEGTGASPSRAGAAGAPSASYAGRLIAAIKPNIVFAENLPGNPAAEVEVRAGPGGTIIGRTLVRSSGHPEWDEAVLRAIDRTASLPKDTDGRVPSRLTITFRPRD